MPYQIKCDGLELLDLRTDDLIVAAPTVSLEVNTVGVGSFTIYNTHPYYDRLRRLRSVFEVSGDDGVIFRGRMTDDTVDFDNGMTVNLEGAMAYFNDSIVEPYAFPKDFEADPEYVAAADGGNVVEYLLKKVIDNHNGQVQEFQRFKLGVVTVADPNNYITRSNSEYQSSWENLKSKLFGSSLGGYLCIRYEDDGNYIDYLSKITETNPQKIRLGENMMNLSNETDAIETYSAIFPLGAKIADRARLTVAQMPDGDIDDDLVKSGNMIYSRRAVANYGWICKPVTWDDVTMATNLQKKAVDRLKGDGIMLNSTIEVQAVDLHLSDAEIQSFRMYRNVIVESATHGLSASYLITKLEIPLLDIKSTRITAGKTQRTLLDWRDETAEQINNVKAEIQDGYGVIEGEFANIAQRVEGVGNEVSEIKQTVGEVSVTITREDGTLYSIMNPEEITIKKVDEVGNITSGFFYDMASNQFKFIGSGEFRSADGNDYALISEREFTVRTRAADGENFDNVFRLGYTTDGIDKFPYIYMGDADGGLENTSLIKMFGNGLWFGTSHARAMNGDFTGTDNTVGFFVNTDESVAYVVNGKDMRNVYVGDAIAKFA